MPNYLYPEAVGDLATAMIGRSGVAPPEHVDAALKHAIVRHFHEDGTNAAPTPQTARGLPAWADGKILSYPVPRQHLPDEVGRVARLLARADEAVGNGLVKAVDSTLHVRLAAFLRSLRHEGWMTLVYECDQLTHALDICEAAQVRAWPQQIIALERGERWRRLRSGQELWAAASGTRWCVRKGQTFDDTYVRQLSRGELAFWVLERDERSLALLSYRAGTGRIEEVKDWAGHAPTRHFQSVRRLSEHLGDREFWRAHGDGPGLSFDDVKGGKPASGCRDAGRAPVGR